jgi:hypothetical protein
MVALRWTRVDLVVTVKLAVEAPAAMVTDAGTDAYAELLLESETTDPPEGAGLPRVSVPVELVPPLTADGLSVTEDKAGAVTVSTADARPAAEMVEVVLEETGMVVTVKVAVELPAATVIEAGT